VKKGIAILLLSLHLFNLGGYQLVFGKAEQAASRRFISQLDRQEYAESQLIEVKVPVNLPYQSNWSDFERYDGEIQIGGIHYNYVKRKLYNDTLILMCLPNPEQMKIASAKENFFSMVNNLQHPGQDKSPSPASKVIKSITTEYVSDMAENSFGLEAQLSAKPLPTHEMLMPPVCMNTPAQPPEYLA
jgi:hypothetical protein